MASLFMDSASKDEFLARIGAIDEDAPQLWGSMSPAKMMAHVNHSVRVSLEEVESEDQSNFILRTVGRLFAFHTPVPWPKGKLQTLPDFLPEPEENFSEQKQALLDSVNRFVEAADANPDHMVLHPAFGRHPLKYWPRFHGRHIDHHLRQFGA